jgi:hypothetical protein
MHRLDRRTLLKGAFASIPLPFLEAMLPASQPQPVVPVRLGFCEHSFGVFPRRWFPERPGRDYAMSDTFRVIERHRQHFTIFGGLENAGHRDDAHHAMENFLCCAYTDSVPGRSVSYTISVDQVAGQRFGQDTRFTSMVLGSYGRPLYGTRSCSLSKNADGTPIPSLVSPMEVFARLFGTRGSYDEVRQQLAQRRSTLDAALDDLRSLQRQVGTLDQQRLDQYLTSIRELERELERELTWSRRPKPRAPLPAPQSDPVVDIDARQHIRLMFDLMVAAFQTDSTRVFSYHLPTLHTLRELGITLSRHSTNHQSASGDRRSQEWEHQIGTFVLEQFGHLIERLQAVREVDGRPLLDHCLILGGSSLEEAGRHRTKNLPVYLIGNGGGVRQGQYLRYREGTPLANLYLTMLQRAGARVERFADSRGALTELVG